MEYQHEQNAPQWVVAVASLFAIVMFSLVTALLRSEQAPVGLALLALVWVTVIYLAILGFTRLRVEVTVGQIGLTWRLGWPKKLIDRASVSDVRFHRNSWLEGWGLRKVWRGWMWNVWGLDSVELVLNTGKIFRIGTDDATGLMAALEN